MSDKLCPFCGAPGGHTSKHKPSCYFMKKNSLDVMYGLTAEWNTRPIEDALRAKLDAAREALSILSYSKNYRLRQYGRISLETPHEITPPWEYARRALAEIGGYPGGAGIERER
jgi:hypothetical protein